MKNIKEIIRKVLKEQSGVELGEAKKKKKKLKEMLVTTKLRVGIRYGLPHMVQVLQLNVEKLELRTGVIVQRNRLQLKKRKLTKKPSSESSLKDWFGRKGAKGSTGGWVDCNAPDGKGGYKSCGRKEGEKRSKYPACRPTPAGCKSKGKGKKWGKNQRMKP